MKLVWTPRACAEQTNAVDFIAEDNPNAALAQLDHIERQTDMLIQYPEIGRMGRQTGSRELVISKTPFIVVYRIKGKRIEILRLLHGSQRWPLLQK